MAQPDSPMQTFWRATIMLGAVTVGGMAFYLYGPSGDKLDAMRSQVLARIHEMTATESPAPTPAGAPLPAQPDGLAPLAPAPLAPAATEASSAGPAPSDMAVLYAELSRLGVGDPQLKPWGTEGQLHRFCCSALTPGGFRRHFDAIRPTPEEAVLVALSQVREWRATASEPINR